jgi:hypothetical protein
MFFYRELSPSDPWVNATIFTENFDQALDYTNTWDYYGSNGGSINVSSGQLLLAAPGFGTRSSLGLKNSNFTSLTNTKATRVQVKIFIDPSVSGNSNNENWASIRLRSTYPGGSLINSDGYKIIFKKDENGVNRIQFMTGDTTNNATEQSGGTRYDIGTYQLGTWYNMRIDTFPTATTEVVRVYQETSLDSGVWTLLGEYEYTQASLDSPFYFSERNPRIYLHSQTYSSGVMYAYFDDFKSYIMDAPATVPPA